MTLLSFPSLSDEGKAQLADPHSLRDYQRSQAAPGLRGGGGGGRGLQKMDRTAGMDMNSIPPPRTVLRPFPGQLASRSRAIDQLGGFPPKMKINESISTAEGRPLESFPLLKAARFHPAGGKKAGLNTCCARGNSN